MYYFNIYTIASIVAIVSCIILGWFVYSKGKDKKVNRFFAYITLFVAFWCFFPLLTSIPESNSAALLLGRIAYFFGVFCPTLFLHFVIVFTAEKNKKEHIVLGVSYSISTVFAILTFNSHFIKGIIRNAPFFAVLPGPLYGIYVFFFTCICLYAFYITIKSYKISDSHKKAQIKYIILAFIIAVISAQSHLLAPYINKETIPHDFLVIFYFSSMAYAIVRHQLMEIEVIIKKTLVFAGLFAAAFAVFVLPTLIIQEFIVSQMGFGARMAGLSVSAFLIILILQPIRNFLVNITDKFLFQKKYDYKELLKTFSTEVLTVLDKDVLVHTTVDRLSNIMKIRSSGILLLNEAKNQYELVASVGVDKDWRNISLGLDNTLASFLSKTKTYLSAKHQGKDSPMPKRIVENMNRLKLELAIPLFIHEDMIGILTLGKKKSDEDYTQDDTDILLPLAGTLAIAISNAMALDELKKTQAEAAQREKMAVVGTLSAGINHEICNPLGIARGHCEAFLLNMKDGLYKNKSDKELLQKAQDIMQKVIHETDRATATTKRLSSFAKPSKGLLTDDIDIREEIDEVLALVSYEMKLDKIEVENMVSKNLTHIIGDKKQIQEVFFNLIRNAAQAIQEKGKITINAREDNGKVYIEVEDTGHGIPEDKLNQIFNPFYTTKEPDKGTGLGLFIVRQVVERNKGRISVESKVGEGARFTLTFPIAEKAKV